MKHDRVDDVLADWAAERPDLNSDTMGIVLRIQTLAKGLADVASEPLKALELEWWEYDALSVLRRQGKPFRMGASEIAEGAMLSVSAMTNRVDRLESRGLVERVVDSGDRRRVLVQLSRRGRALVDRATEARFASAAGALQSLSEKQRKQLDHLLRLAVLAQSG